MQKDFLRGLPTNEIRVTYTSPKDPILVSGIDSAAEIFGQIWNSDLMNIQEQVYVLFLNRANVVIGWRLISTGTIDQTIVDVKLLAALACKVLASAVIIAHNHPSGSVEPSSSDMDLTSKLRDALGVFGVNLADHVILTSKTYFSFAEHGFIQEKESSFLNEIKLSRPKNGIELDKKQKAKLSLIEKNHDEILDCFDAKKEDVLEALDSFFGCWLSNPFQIDYSKDERQSYFELYLALKKQVGLMEYMARSCRNMK